MILYLRPFLHLLFVGCLAASPAAADDWWRAETAHFILYTRSDEEKARSFATELERYDRALRVLRGIPTDEDLAPANKLTVYQFGRSRHIGYFAARRPSPIAGFYIPRAGDSVAFVPLRDDSLGGAREILFHEYAHRFMFQTAAAAYPAWYVEGYAELNSTLELLDGGGFRIGSPPASRSEALFHLGRYPLSRLFDPPPPEEMNWEDGIQPYVRGFSLAHYLTFDRTRKGQLAEYLILLNQGVGSLDAAKKAFGNLDELEKELNKYQFQKSRGVQITIKEDPVRIAVRKLAEDEEAAMDIHMQLRRGVTEGEAEDLAKKSTQLVEAYPDSSTVLLTATEANYDAKEYEIAATFARKVLSISAQESTPHYYLGMIEFAKAKEDATRFSFARQHFINAAAADRNDPRPLFQFFETFYRSGEEPSENARIALETAYTKAPFDPKIRIRLVELMLDEERQRDALALLGPLTFSAHDQSGAAELRKIYQDIEAGQMNNAREALAARERKADNEKQGESI